jgi:hypothetical protein
VTGEKEAHCLRDNGIGLWPRYHRHVCHRIKGHRGPHRCKTCAGTW